MQNSGNIVITCKSNFFSHFIFSYVSFSQMMNFFLTGRKTMWEIEKILVRSSVSFANNIFYNYFVNIIFSSTGQRPASYCHGIVSIECPSGRACVRKLFLQKTSAQKLLTGFLRNFTGMFLRWSSFKFL